MKSSGKYTKDGKKVNVLCLVDRNHQRSMVAVHHSRNFKGIQLIMVTTLKIEEYLRRYNTIKTCR